MAGEGEVDCLSVHPGGRKRGAADQGSIEGVSPRSKDLPQGTISIRVSHHCLCLGGAHSTKTISTA